MHSDHVDKSSTSTEHKEASLPSKDSAPKDTAKKGSTIFVRDFLKHRAAVARYKPTIEFAKDVQQMDVGITLTEEKDGKQSEYILATYIFLPKHRKSDSTKPIPTIYFVSGTAWIASDHEVAIRVCSQLCERASCRVILISHRIAPDNPCPTPFNDCYKAFLYYHNNATDYGIDTNQLGFCGYSSGGNLVALMAEKALRDHISINLQLLVSPVTDLSRSNDEFKVDEDKDTVVSEDFLQHVINYYVVDKSKNRQDPDISPQFIPKENLKGIAPAVIFYGEFDRTRGDAEIYSDILGDAGVSAVKKMFADKNHAFWWHSYEAYDEVAKVINTRFTSTIPISPKITPEYRHEVRFIKFLTAKFDEKALSESRETKKSGSTPPRSPMLAAKFIKVDDDTKPVRLVRLAADKRIGRKKTIDIASESTPFIKKNPGGVLIGVSLFAVAVYNVFNQLSQSEKVQPLR